MQCYPNGLPRTTRCIPARFFSHRLSPAERNYDIGNRELLAVKLALEEWRHWLEGSGVPFIVWTDHKNLEYIQSAKRLNSRQARWALFFGRFDFSISYRPGSKNIKPDALSRIFDISDRPVSPECIIPERLVVSAVTWEIESKVRTALEGVTPPPGCPTGRLFVPEGLRSNVIQWGHCSNVACHPGIGRTMFLVKQRFWWRAMARDIREFVLACSVCARGKTSNRPPEGLLQPLSVPSRPWSHIALDFVTALPPSLGNTVVLTVVDRFSKAAHFIPLPKIALSQGDSDYGSWSRLSHSWPPGRRGFRQGSPIRVQILERVLSTTGGDREFVFWVSPSDQRSDWAGQPGSREGVAMFGHSESHFLVSTNFMGWVRSQLVTGVVHGPFAVWV